MRPGQVITIYTDGACCPNPGSGGWAALIIKDGKEVVLKGSERETTNNRMELTAAIRALEFLKTPVDVTIFTDSEYVQKGIDEWLPRWLEKNWKGSSRKVANRDLWEELIIAVKPHTIHWRWLRGHAGNRYNTMVDVLARQSIPNHLR